MKNPYSILGLEHGASDDDIKKAYRKLAMKHHPDKGGDSEKFKEISQAYQDLTNDNPIDDFPELAEIFRMFGLGSMFGQGQMNTLHSLMMPRGPTISTVIGLTLEELEKGGEYSVKYSRRIPTGKMVSQAIESPFGKMVMASPEEIEKTYTVKINVPPCYDERKSLEFPGLAIGEGVPAGTLEVRIIVHPHDTLSRVPGTNDIRVKIDITLKESLTGFTREITLLNGKSFKLECESIVNPYDFKKITGLGLQKMGYLIISFKIEFPVLLEYSTRETIKNLPDL